MVLPKIGGYVFGKMPESTHYVHTRILLYHVKTVIRNRSLLVDGLRPRTGVVLRR